MRPLRLLAAMFKHETNTFSPVPTPIERFFGYRPAMLVGDAAIAAWSEATYARGSRAIHRGTGYGEGHLEYKLMNQLS